MDSLVYLGKCLLTAFVLVAGMAPAVSNESHHASLREIIKARMERTEAQYRSNKVQLECLAQNAYYEARGEGLIGMAAVTRVVLNRVAHGFAKTPCEVVHQRTVRGRGEAVMCQFSWTCESKLPPKRWSREWLDAQSVAYGVLILDQWQDVVSETTLFFHRVDLKPGWRYKRERVIGNHVFYQI